MDARALLTRAAPVLPVLELRSVDGVGELADALRKGGVTAMEVALRSDCALNAIAWLARERPDMLIGAGTVVAVRQLGQALRAGARFAVSPGFSDELARAARDASCCWLPGVATAGELMRAMRFGLKAFKLFPADVAGGVDALRSFAGPFAQARFCPTGGIDERNYLDYLALDNVPCVGGSWLASAERIAAADWRGIAERAAAARRAAAGLGGPLRAPAAAASAR